MSHKVLSIAISFRSVIVLNLITPPPFSLLPLIECPVKQIKNKISAQASNGTFVVCVNLLIYIYVYG